MRAFVYRHIVCFEETNVVGNVYFARHVAWQGACRETFLREHAPGVLDEITRDLRLVTIGVSCDYFHELRAFDEVEVRMRLGHLRANRIGLNFDYRVLRGGGALQCAVGRQEIGCMRAEPDGPLAVCALPDELRRALELYSV